jgi:hypothetical protein
MTTSMGGSSGDYNTMTSRAILGQMPKRIPKEFAEPFDTMIRNKPMIQGQPAVTNWPGINSKNLEEFLLENPHARSSFPKVMDTKAIQELGFYPHVGQTRWAITEPDVFHWPTGDAGRGVFRLADNPKVITDPAIPHGSYRAQTGGTNLGQSDVGYPLEMLLRDFTARRRAEGFPQHQDAMSIRRQMPSQIVDNELKDTMSRYREAVKKAEQNGQ